MTVSLRMSTGVLWFLRIAATAVGVALGFGVKPLTQWLVGMFDSAPGPLRAAAALPTAVAVPVLAVVGVVAGAWLAHVALKESLKLTVTTRHVRLDQNAAERHIPREQIAEVFLDAKKDLVLLDARTTELARNKATDLNADDIAKAFTGLRYPWRGTTDPYETSFQSWVDGHPDLTETRNQLLRDRARALTDKKTGAAAEFADRLQAAGVVVRDRDGAQQYRLVG
jgi:hypothetical protein